MIAIAELDQGANDHSAIIRGSLHELQGHSGVLICADWLSGGDQVITASWDRTANLYDTQTGELLNMLVGKHVLLPPQLPLGWIHAVA